MATRSGPPDWWIRQHMAGDTARQIAHKGIVLHPAGPPAAEATQRGRDASVKSRKARRAAKPLLRRTS